MICLAPILLLLAAGDQKQPAGFEQISRAAATAREQERTDEAITLYRRAVRVRPSWSEGWWYLGTLLYDRDSYPDARDALRRLVSLDPKSGPGFALLGLSEYQTREYQQALADLNTARSLGTGDDLQMKRVVQYHSVILLTRFEEYESALRVLERLVRTGQIGPDIINAAGLAGLRKPILPDGIPPADKDLVEHAGRAVCAMAERRSADAQRFFDELVAAYPKALNVHYLYASFLLGSDPDAALREFENELALDPKHVQALVNIALEYEKRGDIDKALPYARRAVDAAPDFFAARGVLGRLLTDTDEIDKGIHELEIARKQAPDSPQVRFALASAYSKAGRKADAAREREEFRRLKQLGEARTEP